MGKMSMEQEKSDSELWDLSVGEDVFTRAEALQELGARYLTQGKHDEGLNFMNAALDIWRKQDDLVGIGRSCYAQGVFHLGHNRFELAVTLLEESVASYHNAFRTVWEADALRALGSAYQSLGALELAQDMFTRASSGYGEMDEYFRASLAEIDLGNVLAARFELHMAMMASQRALTFAQKAENPVMVLRCNARIAALWHGLGEVETSLEISRASVLTAEYLEDEELLMLVKDDLGETLAEIGRYEEALPLLEEVSTFWKAQNYVNSALATDTVRASALHGLGRTNEALALLNQVSATSRNLNSKNIIVDAALVMGDIQTSQEAHNYALGSYMEGASVSAENDDPWLERYAWLCVAKAHFALGNRAEAQEILDELTLEAWGDCLRERRSHLDLSTQISNTHIGSS